jgi:hypothetical protein
MKTPTTYVFSQQPLSPHQSTQLDQPISSLIASIIYHQNTDSQQTDSPRSYPSPPNNGLLHSPCQNPSPHRLFHPSRRSNVPLRPSPLHEKPTAHTSQHHRSRHGILPPSLARCYVDPKTYMNRRALSPYYSSPTKFPPNTSNPSTAGKATRPTGF